MRQMLKLWNDDSGYIVTLEMMFIVTILVLGIISGLVAVRQAMLSELIETAQAIMALNQSYSFSGQSNCEASTAGSAASDTNNSISESSTAATPAVISQTPCD
jgi:hypothetical protein